MTRRYYLISEFSLQYKFNFLLFHSTLSSGNYVSSFSFDFSQLLNSTSRTVKFIRLLTMNQALCLKNYGLQCVGKNYLSNAF